MKPGLSLLDGIVLGQLRLKAALEARKYMQEEPDKADYRNAASKGEIFPSYDVNRRFRGDQSQHVP